MSDLIPRHMAVSACAIGPSDEWSKSTRSGYEQAALDCTMNILRIENEPPNTLAAFTDAELLAAAMQLPDVRALVGARKTAATWQPIETAPLDGSEIIVWSYREDAFVAFWHGPSNSWLWTSRDLSGDERLDPTHWQPLPPPPKGGE